MKTEIYDIMLWFLIPAVLAAGIAIWVYASSVEAKTFNRLTGNDLTTWEAMWVNARIDCN